MKVIKYVMLAVLYLLSSTLFAYNRNQALRYAERWWNSRNVWKDEQGYNLNYPFSDYGVVDCANFVSQCLIAGGFNLHNTGIVDGNHSIVYCDYLHGYLTGLSITTYERIEYVDGSEEAPAWMGPGDVIMFGGKGGFQGDDWQHAVFVVSGSGNQLYCAAHSENHEDAPWKETWWGTGEDEFTIATFYHISDWEGAVADLQPFQPDGWSGSLVVSDDPNTNISDYNFQHHQTVYADWAFTNDNSYGWSYPVDIPDTIYYSLYISDYWYADSVVSRWISPGLWGYTYITFEDDTVTLPSYLSDTDFYFTIKADPVDYWWEEIENNNEELEWFHVYGPTDIEDAINITGPTVLDQNTTATFTAIFQDNDPPGDQVSGGWNWELYAFHTNGKQLLTSGHTPGLYQTDWHCYVPDLDNWSYTWKMNGEGRVSCYVQCTAQDIDYTWRLTDIIAVNINYPIYPPNIIEAWSDPNADPFDESERNRARLTFAPVEGIRDYVLDWTFDDLYEGVEWRQVQINIDNLLPATPESPIRFDIHQYSGHDDPVWIQYWVEFEGVTEVQGDIINLNMHFPNFWGHDAPFNFKMKSIKNGMSSQFWSNGANCTIIDDPGDIILTSPIGGESWHEGTEQMIQWQVRDFNYQVKLFYNTGVNWVSMAGDSTDNDGEFLWNMPFEPTNNCRVLVEGALHGSPKDKSKSFNILAMPQDTVISQLAFSSDEQTFDQLSYSQIMTVKTLNDSHELVPVLDGDVN